MLSLENVQFQFPGNPCVIGCQNKVEWKLVLNSGTSFLENVDYPCIMGMTENEERTSISMIKGILNHGQSDCHIVV